MKDDQHTCGAGVLGGAEWAAEIWERQKCLDLNECPDVQTLQSGDGGSQERRVTVTMVPSPAIPLDNAQCPPCWGAQRFHGHCPPAPLQAQRGQTEGDVGCWGHFCSLQGPVPALR